VYVSIANNISNLSKLFFTNEHEAAQHFDDLRTCHTCSHILLKELESAMDELTESVIKENINKYEIDISNLKAETDLSKISMMTRQNFLRCINDANPEVQAIALKAKEELKTYREKILGVLKASGADMSRTDLLEHLVGPKAYLFEYYNEDLGWLGTMAVLKKLHKVLCG
jgi:hypothetical protein